MRWIKDHTLAAADKTVRLPGWLISPEVDTSHGGSGKQGQRDEKVQNWKDQLWRVWWATHGGEKSNWSQLERSARKIGPVPRQNYFPSRWRIGKSCIASATLHVHSNLYHPNILDWPPSPFSCSTRSTYPWVHSRPSCSLLPLPPGYHITPKKRIVERTSLGQRWCARTLVAGAHGGWCLTGGWHNALHPDPTSKPGIPLGKFLLALLPSLPLNYIRYRL